MEKRPPEDGWAHPGSKRAKNRRTMEITARDAGVNSACTIDNESAAAVNTAELLQHVVGG